MDNNNQFKTPPTNTQPSYTPLQQSPTPNVEAMLPAGKQKKVGPIVATLIVVLVVIIAALYFIAVSVGKNTVPAESGTNTTSNDLSTLSVQGSVTVQAVTNTSDDVQSIANDLDASTNGLDEQSF